MSVCATTRGSTTWQPVGVQIELVAIDLREQLPCGVPDPVRHVMKNRFTKIGVLDGPAQVAPPWDHGFDKALLARPVALLTAKAG